MSADLLIELGCEELPPKALDGIRDALFQGVCKGLSKQNIEFNAESSRSLSSPRRIALSINGVADGQPDQELERKGPALQAAFDAEGNPTQAALGFARSVGKTVDQLETLKSDKGEWLYARIQQKGKPLNALLFPILEQALKQLPVPRPMRWSDHEFSFVRPVHWLVVLHGGNILEGQLLGQSAGRLTRGHRTHAPGPHRLDTASDYVEVLRQACVLVDQDERRTRIREMAIEAEPQVIIDPGLLEEVKNLVEWPIAVPCSFDLEFLEVPHEALIASMQDHQKFFPVRSPDHAEQVVNRFVAISNVDSTDVSAVREGYERVIRPRLADARFFLEQDLKLGLASFIPQLDRVVFQNKIGTIGDKCRRMSKISKHIAEFNNLDSSAYSRAAKLSKCDLMSHMVGEFPELQGRMGEHYALAADEMPEVAAAIGEHYAPRFAGDDIPRTRIGQVVSLADRLDTLVGIFAAGMKPSGNKDPFALRRSALGLCRILLEADIDVPLDELLNITAEQLHAIVPGADEIIPEVREFIIERLRSYYREKGYATELVSAALASPWTSIPDLGQRIVAISGFMDSEAARSLATSNKRIGNILRKSGQSISIEIDEERFVIDAEQGLFDEVTRLEKSLESTLADKSYDTALKQLAQLRAPVETFFETVMVMDEDPEIRNNRLALLKRLKGLFDQIGDLSVLG